MGTKTIRAAIAAICVATAFSPAYAEAKEATLKTTYSGSTLTGFQALVKLSDGDDYGFSYAEAGGSSHYIWFTSADGATVYPHEIDKWDASGDSFVWVRLPELKKGTTFKMHWSDSSGDVPSASGNVWDGYVGVWHMNATGTTAEPDSTANGIGAAPVNNSGASTSIGTATGKVGAGRAVTQGTMLKVTDHASNGRISDAKVFTIGGWVNRTATGSYPRIFCGNVDSGRTQWELFATADNDISVRGGSTEFSGCTVNNGTSSGWHYLTVVYSGTTATLYDNGTLAKSGNIGNAAQGGFFTIGGWTGRNDRSFAGTFDEVRMYNGALSADRVKADYATMNDPTTFLTLAPAPQAVTLTHRWSFNTDGTDYSDSIAVNSASWFGDEANRKTAGGKLVLKGNGSGTGSLNLGKNLLGSGDATVEIWASHDAAKNYARVFDYGNGSYGKTPNQTDCFIFAWSAGTEVSRDIVLLKKANATAFERHGTMSVMEWGKQYYFAVTFKDNGGGSSTIKWMRRDAVTGALERYKEETVSSWTLATLAATNPDFWLGVSKYNTDYDANASYDEVRIWNGALGEDQLAANAAMGPNAFTTGLSDGFNLAAGAVFRVPSAGYTASGPVTLGAGAKLLFDTASFDGQSITFSATGFSVSGNVLDYVELTDSVNFTASLSGSLITVTRNASAPVTAQWAGASAPASAADLAVAANWTCYDASGTVVPNVVPGAATTIVIPDGTTSFTIPSDATPTWAGIRFGGHSGTKWGQNDSNGTSSSYTWRDTALKDYAFKGDGDLANLNNANTTWQDTNMKGKRVRFDGWVNIPAEKAGRWYLSQAFDDYFTFAIDGEWVLHSNNWNYYTYLNYDVTPGWHRFTVVCGDTSGGFGSGSIDVGGVKVPFSFSVNGGAAQRFDQLTQGSGNSTVQLAADCDWSALGTINLSNGTVIDLNGHNLFVDDFSADFLGAMVTNTSATTSTIFFKEDPYSSTATAQALIKGVGVNISLALAGAKTATWTGGGNNGNPATASNWQVKMGDVVLGGVVPDESTVVSIEGQNVNLQVPVGTSLTCASFEIGNCTFTADCDWRGLSKTPVITGTANLNGHNLHLPHLAAAGGSFANGASGTTNEVRFTAADTTYSSFGEGTLIENAANLSLAGNVRIALVKEGDGTFSSSGFSLGNQSYEVDFVQPNGTANHTWAQIGKSGYHGVYRMSGGSVKATDSFEVGPNGVGEFLQTGGSVTFQNWFNLGRYNNGNGTYTITGGSLLVNKASNNGADKVYIGCGSNSKGTLNVGGSGQVEFKCHLALGSKLDSKGGKGYANVYGNGSLHTTGDTFIGQTSGETGEVTMDGGTFNVGSVLRVGESGSGVFRLNGGALSAGSWAGLGVNGDGTGTFTQNGGTFTMTNNTLNVGNDGNGWYYQNGGTNKQLRVAIGANNQNNANGTYDIKGGLLDVSSYLYVGGNKVGQLVIGGDGVVIANGGVTIANGSTGSGTLTVTGGVLKTTFLQKGSGTLNSVTFNGGTLVATNAASTAETFFSGIGAITVGANGFVFDVASYNISLPAEVSIATNATIAVKGTGTLDVSGTTFDLTAAPTESFDLLTTEGAEFSTLPPVTVEGEALSGGWRVVKSADGKKITIKRRKGVMIIAH